MAKSRTPLARTTGQDNNVDGNGTGRCDLVGHPNPGYCLFVRFKDGLARLCLRPVHCGLFIWKAVVASV
jgi:hypothetical protein